MYKVPSSEAQSMFERHPRRIRWGIFWLLVFMFIYILGVYISVALTMTDAQYDARLKWGAYIFNEEMRSIDLLIWLGLMISLLFHRSIIQTTWFLKGITVATLVFVSYILISMPTYW